MTSTSDLVFEADRMTGREINALDPIARTRTIDGVEFAFACYRGRVLAFRYESDGIWVYSANLSEDEAREAIYKETT